MDLGDTSDFELSINSESWDAEKFSYGCRIFIPDTEYGGIIDDIESIHQKTNYYPWKDMERNVDV